MPPSAVRELPWIIDRNGLIAISRGFPEEFANCEIALPELAAAAIWEWPAQAVRFPVFGAAKRPLGLSRYDVGGELSNPFDPCAERLQFVFDALVSAVDVIDAIDDGCVLRHQSGKHK
jgi:hypothetical protein